MLILFALTLFVSSALLFLVQPMFAKMVLPMLGGTPAVWNTCVVFFEAALLGGYAYAHATTAWLGVKRQAVLHCVLVLIPSAALPIAIRGGWLPPTDHNPILWLLGVLAISVGLPFFVVSSTAPLLQKWFSTTRHRAAGDPYFLYTASNAGSIAALLSYPFLLEPLLRLREQSLVWTAGYALLAVLTLACAVVTSRRAADAAEPDAAALREAAAPPVPWARRWKWIALAAAPSSLMLGVTTYLSTDIAAVPLLWIIPLVLYLASFILAFSVTSRSWAKFANRLLPIAVLGLVIVLVTGSTQPADFIIPLHLVVFFVTAWVCHLELASDRPSTAHLTEFYLWISVGGLLGGLFNTLVAPLIFAGIAEYPIALVLACTIRSAYGEPAIVPRWSAGAIRVVVVGVITAAIMVIVPRTGLSDRFLYALLGLPVLISFGVSRSPIYFGPAVGAMLAAGALYSGYYGKLLHSERTFFGVHRVSVESEGRYHALFHGTTLHGRQSLNPARSSEALTYFHRSGPIGQVLDLFGGRRPDGRVGVIGLGTGSLAAYAAPGQEWTFYEIDPAVVRISQDRRYFTFLDDTRAKFRLVLGDARLSLMHAPPEVFDLLILDAFSSDAIPVHLLTREALAIYQNALAGDGFMAFHISNRHLALQPVLARLARDGQLTALVRNDPSTPEDEQIGKMASEWVVMARSAEALTALRADPRWGPLEEDLETPLWTDDFSNIVSAFRR